MIGTSRQYVTMRRVVCTALVAGLLVGFSVPAAAGGAEKPAADFSLRYIPEALPVEATSGETGAGEDGTSWYSQSATVEPVKELSMSRAILYSLLLPGLGDWYAGERDRAKAFFIVDAALWTTFIVFQAQGHRREDGYQQYAQTFAGIAGTDHSDDFYSVIGQYSSSDAYEAEFKKESRPELWPNVSYDELEGYYTDNRVEDFEEWAWRTFDSRVDYRSMRSSSKVAYRRSGYVIAVAALNRVVASVFAWQAVKASRGDFDEPAGTDDSAAQGGYHLDISSPSIGTRGEFSAAVSLIRSF